MNAKTQQAQLAGRPTQPRETLNGAQRGMLAVEVNPPGADAAGPSADGLADPVLEFVASDATLDRTGEIIQAAGWRLENYRRNPVFQNAHNYGDVRHTLGRAIAVEVRDNRLWLRVRFAAEVNPCARLAYELYRRGFLNAVSVGFLPLRWENGSERTPWRRRFLEQELLEVSAVAVPANPNALMISAVNNDELGRALLRMREVAAKLKSEIRNPKSE